MLLLAVQTGLSAARLPGATTWAAETRAVVTASEDGTAMLSVEVSPNYTLAANSSWSSA